MSANIDSMMYVGERPWHGLGKSYDVAPRTSAEIIEGAGLQWTVGSDPMKTDRHGEIPHYHSIYREDTNMVLGVVNRTRPQLIQNVDAFNAFEQLLGHEVEVETAAGLGHGEQVFGCFKINEGYNLLDDAVDHYFVVLNEHLKADGKITILNTPIRVVCQNTLSAALSSSVYKLRIPFSTDRNVNAELARKIIQGKDLCKANLGERAEKMAVAKISRDHVEAVLDELFPMMISKGDESLHTRANETQEMMRSTFMECMAADDLGNFRGTQYQVFNALTNFESHFFRKPENAYDLDYRMKGLPGMGADSSRMLAQKYLKIKDKIAA